MSSGPQTAAPSDDARRPHSRAVRGLVRLAPVGVCLLLLLATVAAAEDFERLRTPGSKQQYLQLVAAWQARSPEKVVALMQPRGSLRLVLLTPQVAGTYRAAQATAILKHYFAQVSQIALKDVTNKNQRLPRGWMVRKYEYRYTPRGRDPVKTLLTVTMKGDRQGTWILDSIKETRR